MNGPHKPTLEALVAQWGPSASSDSYQDAYRLDHATQARAEPATTGSGDAIDDDPAALNDAHQDATVTPGDDGPSDLTRAPLEVVTGAHGDDEADDDDEDHPWRPVPVLDRIGDLTAAPLEAPLWLRSDGQGLLYRGRTHSLSGEGGHGKSLVALAACLNVVRHGGRAAFLDMGEDVYETTAKRLLQIGATDDDLTRLYWAGIDRTWEGPADIPDWLAFLEDEWDLVIIDSVAMGLDLWGYQGNDNDGVNAWWRRVPKEIAKRTGAAVLVLDHVVKNKDNRGRAPIGAVAKFNNVSGVQFQLEVHGAGFRPGGRGSIVLRATKDRGGTVEASGGPGRHPVVAVVTIDTTEGRPAAVDVDPPGVVPGINHAADDRVTDAMAEISAHLAGLDGRGVGVEAIRHAVGRKKADVIEALARLVEGKHVREWAGAKNARLHAHVRPYPDPVPPTSGDSDGPTLNLDDGPGS